MNIVALSLGLAPIPPRPAAAPVRAHRLQDERKTSVRRTRRSTAAWRAEMLQMLRGSGPATTADVAAYYNTTCKLVRAHLQRLCDDGQVMCRKLGRGHLWYLPERGDA